MDRSADQNDRERVWGLIKDAHTALLTTIDEDGSFEARPMGCLQKQFDGTLWFLTFCHSRKLRQLRSDDRVLVTYVKPERQEYVAISGRAKMIHDRAKLNELWNEGLRVWFPNGPGDPELALLAVEVEKAEYWASPASVATYAFAYLRARLTGESASADQMAETRSVDFRARRK